AMDDSAIVRGGHAARDGGGVLDRAARRERAARDALAKRLAFEQLQHDVERIAGRAEVVHGDEVRMIEEAEGARLLLESRDDLRVAGGCGGQELDGDFARELRIARAIDLTHAARADE